MSRVARCGKASAHEGQGRALARILLRTADALAGDPGCELCLVNRQVGDPDVIWVRELWRDQEDLDASLDREMVDLELLGGKRPDRVLS